MIKRILLGICDPQHTESASLYARELGQQFDALVTVIAVTDLHRLRDVGPVAVGAGSFAKEMVDDRIAKNTAAIEGALKRLLQRFKEANVRCEIATPHGDPYTALAAASRFHDLMVFGLHGLLEHGVTDEPSYEIIRLIEAGVYPILAPGTEHRDTRRILMAYSGSVESARNLRNYAHLHLWPDAEFKIVYFGGEDDESSTALAEAAAYLQDHGLTVETDIAAGSSKHDLLPYAETWRADLIVIGNSAKSLLRRRVFGETALRAVRESKIPLFLSQ